MPTEIPGFPGLEELTLVDPDDSAAGRQDTGPARFGERSGEYRGPERRRFLRRQGGDRRTEVRFETGKDDRRSCLERRKGGWKSHFTV